MHWQCGRFELALDRPLIMGVVNVTPDSFSDGSGRVDTAGAIAHARRLLDEGADIIDIGGESTRPGAGDVPAAVELGRVLPVLDGLAGCDRPLSIDTRKPEVMRAALAGGADIINDVGGFRVPAARAAVAGARCGLVVMHMQGEPSNMQESPVYLDVVSEVKQFLYLATQALAAAGVALQRIALDPGFGFGKTLAHNVALMRGLPELVALGRPVVVGVSRKGMIGALTGRAVGERQAGSVAAMLAAVARGAHVVRVHDVAQSRDALAVWTGLNRQD